MEWDLIYNNSLLTQEERFVTNCYIWATTTVAIRAVVLLYFLCFFAFTEQCLAKADVFITHESYVHVIHDIGHFHKVIEIEGSNLSGNKGSIPVSVLEMSSLEKIELFLFKNGKWKKTKHNFTVSNISFSSFFSGVKNYFIEIPENATFKIVASLSEKETIFLSRMYADGYYESASVHYAFELPEGLALSTSTGETYDFGVEFSSDDLPEDGLSYLIHPKDEQALTYFSSWFQERIDPMLEMSADLIPEDLKLLAEKGDKSELASACFSFVKEKIKYIDIENGMNAIIPRRCESVLEKKIGDCKDMATLLTAIYRHFGLEAYPTISRTNSKDGIFDFPSLSEANHMICSLYLEGEWYFLDPTEDACIFGDPSVQILGTEGFLVGHNEKHFIQVPEVPRSNSQVSLVYTYNLEAAKLELEAHVSGKMNNLLYTIQLKQHKPTLVLEKIFKAITDMPWSVEETEIVDTMSILRLSVPITSSMFSTIGSKKLFDMSFIPSVEMLTSLFYSNDYPAYASTVNLSVQFDGEVVFETPELKGNHIEVKLDSVGIFEVLLALPKVASEEDFEKNTIHKDWTRIWSKPITVRYEN